MLGFGNLGSAIAEGAIRRRVVHPRGVLVVDVDPARRAHAERLGCRVATSVDAIDVAAPILVSVKPQIWPEVAAPLAATLASAAVGSARPLVVSVMAGLTSAAIGDALGGCAVVVRAMPNTPARIGLAITALAWPEEIPDAGRLPVRAIFESVGDVVELPESLLHAVTAVGGSGPAYVFKLAEGMERAAVELGIPVAIARRLVSRTIRGAGGMLVETDAEPATLRDAVTSRGGTTAAALEQFERWGLEPAISDAIRAAEARSRELSGDSAPPRGA